MSVLLDVRQGPSPYTVQNPVEYTSTELKEEPTCVVHALCAISHTSCFTNTVSLSPTMTCNREHREAVQRYAWLASRPQGNCTSLCLWHLSWATLLILAEYGRKLCLPPPGWSTDCQCMTLTHMPFPLPPSKVPLQLVGPWSLLGWSPRRPEHIPAH